MSVLPSFKSAFSSFAEVESTDAIGVADDSGIPNRPHPSTTHSIPPTSSFQDHFPRSNRQITTNSLSFPSISTTNPRNTSSILPTEQKLSLTSRPAIPLLPLDLLSSDAPSFYFDNRPEKRFTTPSTSTRKPIDPLQLETIGIPTDSYSAIAPDSCKYSQCPAVHAGAYKRPRSQSVSAGGSYVKLQSQSSSELHAITQQQHTANPPTLRAKRPRTDALSSAPVFGHSPAARSRREQTLTAPHLSSTTLTIQAGKSKLSRTTTSGLALRKPPSLSPELSEGRSLSRRTRSISESASGSRHRRPSPTPSCDPRNEATNSSILRGGKGTNLVTFAPPSFSHRSAGSKARVHGFNTRILAEDEYLEDSTSRIAVDVLSSPRQHSLNSTGTGRRLRGILGAPFALSMGPTASDLSVLLGTSWDNQSERKEGRPVDESDRSVVESEEEARGKNDGGDKEKEKAGDAIVTCQKKKRGASMDDGLRKRGTLKMENVDVVGKMGGSNGMEQCGQMIGYANGHVNGHLGEGTTRSGWKGQANGNDENLVREGGFEAWRQEPKPMTTKRDENWNDGGDRYLDVEDKNGNVREVKHEESIVDGKEIEKNGEDGESVECTHCGRHLRNAVTLQNHIRVVHDHSGNYQCNQCGLTFMWRSTLGNHVRLVHEKQRPYSCEECAKSFRWKSHLREHYWVVHKGEKPFKCETCGKTFGRKNNMQKHMRKHTEQASN